jgi:hypothetical protein
LVDLGVTLIFSADRIVASETDAEFAFPPIIFVTEPPAESTCHFDFPASERNGTWAAIPKSYETIGGQGILANDL